MPELFVAISRLSATVLGLSAAVLKLSAAMLKSFGVVPELSAAMPRSSALMFAFVSVTRSSALIPLSVFMPVLHGLSPLPFSALSLPKTLMPNLGARRRILDNTISE